LNKFWFLNLDQKIETFFETPNSQSGNALMIHNVWKKVFNFETIKQISQMVKHSKALTINNLLILPIRKRPHTSSQNLRIIFWFNA